MAKKFKNIPQGSIEWLIIGMLLVAIGFSVFSGWEVLQGSGTDPVSNLIHKASPTPTTDALPSLQLNYTHNRQGSQVVVNPSNIGRDNPFTIP